jgi:hypothetical protein
MNERRSEVTATVSRCQWRFALGRQGVIASDLPIACRVLPSAHGFGALPAESSIRGRAMSAQVRVGSTLWIASGFRGCLVASFCGGATVFESFEVWDAPIASQLV